MHLPSMSTPVSSDPLLCGEGQRLLQCDKTFGMPDGKYT